MPATRSIFLLLSLLFASNKFKNKTKNRLINDGVRGLTDRITLFKIRKKHMRKYS